MYIHIHETLAEDFSLPPRTFSEFSFSILRLQLYFDRSGEGSGCNLNVAAIENAD